VIHHRNNLDLEETYFQIISRKTASLCNLLSIGSQIRGRQRSA
jgi:hypothetical protein